VGAPNFSSVYGLSRHERRLLELDHEMHERQRVAATASVAPVIFAPRLVSARIEYAPGGAASISNEGIAGFARRASLPQVFSRGAAEGSGRTASLLTDMHQRQQLFSKPDASTAIGVLRRLVL
jgi:hypothetical protein